MSDLSIPKLCENRKFSVPLITRYDFEMIDEMVGKGENAYFDIFSLFSTEKICQNKHFLYFQQTSFLDFLK